MRTVLLLIFTLLLYGNSFAKGYFEWSPLAKNAYENTLQLRFTEARQQLLKMQVDEPDNLIRLHVEDYIDFFTVYIGEEVNVFKKLEDKKEARLAQIVAEGDPNSPYYLYLQADIRLHWALARLKFEEYTTTFFETNKAFKLLNKNSKKFPDFIPNKKDLGLLHAIVGTIPDNYRWALEWMSSMEGTVAEGKRELQEVLTYATGNEFVFTAEVQVFYAYLLLHLENDRNGAWEIIQQSKLKAADSPLSTFIIANIASYAQETDKAIELLENRPNDKAYFQFPYLDYMLGEAKLNRLDQDADIYLQKFLQQYRGRNFIKDAYRRLSWHALLFGEQSNFKKYQRAIVANGYTIVGADESAQMEAESGVQPQLDLLKARLLFDGGYYQHAYEVLAAKEVSIFQTAKEQLEFYYRIGRITHELQDFSTALEYYQRTINQGKNTPYYYACRAALEQGKIFETQKKYTAAKSAYQNCLTISPKEYKSGLHQQAKAGLLRLK